MTFIVRIQKMIWEMYCCNNNMYVSMTYVAYNHVKYLATFFEFDGTFVILIQNVSHQVNTLSL